MKKPLFVLVTIIFSISSCKSVYSTLSIDANKSFVLGDNEHDEFEVSLKNISKNNVESFKMPMGASKKLIQTLVPGKLVIVNIEKNTSLYIDNKSASKATVELNLKSNSHLSMGYEN